MKYLVFNTEAEAFTAEALIAEEIGCVVIGVNAATGLPDPTAQMTEQWAIPQQIVDGRWVFPSHDGTGVDPSPDWWPPVEP